MRSFLFYATCFGFAAGVLLRSLTHVPGILLLVALAVSILSILIFTTVWKQPKGCMAAVCVLATTFGVLRYAYMELTLPDSFESVVGGQASISGVIVDDPVQTDTGVELTLETPEEAGSAKVLLLLKQDNGYAYGDTLSVQGVIEHPANFLTDQGTTFDYIHYLEKDGIRYLMHNPKVAVVATGGGNPIKRLLFAAKEKFSGVIHSALPEPESLVMGAMLLGERKAMGQELRSNFTTTGTIHIVTIGGYHITLIADWIMKLLSFLPLTYALWAGILTIVLYIMATGGVATTVRGGIMASLALIAQTTGRTYDMLRALVIAGFLMILWNPFVLVFDASFQLSFTATVAIIFLTPLLEPYATWIKWKWLRDIILVTVAMYAFTLPLILYKIGTLSLVSLPANIAIVPALPVAMIMGFALGILGLVPVLAKVIGYPTYLVVHYIVSAVKLCSQLPFASVPIPNFPLAATVLIYLLFGIFLWVHRKYLMAKEDPSVVLIVSEGRVKIIRAVVLAGLLLFTLSVAGAAYYGHYRDVAEAHDRMHALLTASTTETSVTQIPFTPPLPTKNSGCVINGPYPDPACTPGAVFAGLTREQACVKGYTASVRKVSTKLRRQIYAEYAITYPEPHGSYEADHFIPLALGGSNDATNLFPEAASPTPGFHEKDIVEVYLQEEMCAGRVELPIAQKQIATDWLAVYNNLTPEQIQRIKSKYSNGSANQ